MAKSKYKYKPIELYQGVIAYGTDWKAILYTSDSSVVWMCICAKYEKAVQNCNKKYYELTGEAIYD